MRLRGLFFCGGRGIGPPAFLCGDWASGIPSFVGIGPPAFPPSSGLKKCIKSSAQARWHTDSCGGDYLRYRDGTFEGGARDTVRRSVWREKFAPKF